MKSIYNKKIPEFLLDFHLISNPFLQNRYSKLSLNLIVPCKKSARLVTFYFEK